jgi:hypothetical protein
MQQDKDSLAQRTFRHRETGHEVLLEVAPIGAGDGQAWWNISLCRVGGQLGGGPECIMAECLRGIEAMRKAFARQQQQLCEAGFEPV